MPTHQLILSFCLLLFAGCEKDRCEPDLPACVKELIEQPATDGGIDARAVYRWEVEGATYFYVEQECCDRFNLLFATDCTLLCAPDGGITGRGEGDCPDLDGDIERTLIWEAE